MSIWWHYLLQWNWICYCRFDLSLDICSHVIDLPLRRLFRFLSFSSVATKYIIFQQINVLQPCMLQSYFFFEFLEYVTSYVFIVWVNHNTNINLFFYDGEEDKQQHGWGNMLKWRTCAYVCAPGAGGWSVRVVWCFLFGRESCVILLRIGACDVFSRCNTHACFI